MKTDTSSKVARDLVRFHGLRARAVAEEHARQAAGAPEMLLWTSAAILLAITKAPPQPVPEMLRVRAMRGCGALPEAA